MIFWNAVEYKSDQKALDRGLDSDIVIVYHYEPKKWKKSKTKK
jgi:hypothetical protein